ncbi:MAG: phosphoglycerate dehydrogenase-like enzyme [Natronomonas sp.]|jgi:phosphoglycerate dehydrogenase-like enzyme
MTNPTVLVSHTVDAGYWSDIEALRAAVETRVPGVDLRVAHTPPETRELAGEADALLATHVPTDLLEAAPNLRWVQALSSGVDFLDTEAIADHGVALTNAAGVHAEPIAEQVIGYLLTFERGIHTGIQQQQAGLWQRYSGGEVRGKTLGIVGIGAIGGRTAEYAQAFGMTVVGTKRDPDTAPKPVDEVYAPGGLFEVLRRSEYVLLSCPLTPETRGLVGREKLGAMRGDAVLVNVARGAVVDEDALVYALQQGGIRGAALDVFEAEPLPPESVLWDLPNVVVTPHMAGSTPEKFERVAGVFAENYRAFADGRLEELRNRVV